MNPQDFFAFAEHITQDPPQELTEIAYRSAITRLYYGIFHWIQMRYHIRVPSNQVNRSHAYVKEVLAQNVMSDDILREYHFLEQIRVEADYFLEKYITMQVYDQALQCKEKLFHLIEENPDFLGFLDGEGDFFRKHKK
ncbi:MAG TPA: hypothetical protein VKK79_12535 [Candidatus Lokiarchaeia archaeon]|nr:hypothetical protein [Candidatus Lokiarchaeia archaeon]